MSALPREQDQFTRNARALFSLSQTQRRLAHRCKREAAQWEAAGNYRNYADLMVQQRNYWRRAKQNLYQARLQFHSAMQQEEQRHAA